jgi:hypothetical protein
MTNSAAPTSSMRTADDSGPSSSGGGSRDRFVEFVAGSPAPSQQIDAHPGDHGGEPGFEVLDRVGTCACQPQPRLLHRIVGVPGGSEHAIGDRAEPLALRVEDVGQRGFTEGEIGHGVSFFLFAIDLSRFVSANRRLR